jgi:hypothetical protein
MLPAFDRSKLRQLHQRESHRFPALLCAQVF